MKKNEALQLHLNFNKVLFINCSKPEYQPDCMLRHHSNSTTLGYPLAKKMYAYRKLQDMEIRVITSFVFCSSGCDGNECIFQTGLKVAFREVSKVDFAPVRDSSLLRWVSWLLLSPMWTFPTKACQVLVESKDSLSSQINDEATNLKVECTRTAIKLVCICKNLFYSRYHCLW